MLTAAREYISLSLIMMIYLIEGISAAVVIALFTVHAREQHGAEQTFIGGCISIFQFIKIVICFFLRPSYPRNRCSFGGILAGGSMISFAFADLFTNIYLFEAVSTVSYLVYGIGSIFYWSYGVCALSIIKPNYVNFLIPASMFAWYFGLSIGSSMGTYMYIYFGYIATISFYGVLKCVCSAILWIIFPNIQNTNDKCNESITPKNPYGFLKNGTIVLIIISEILACCFTGFCDATITFYFEKHFRLTLTKMALYISMSSVTIIFAAIITIPICWAKFSNQLFVFNIFLCVISSALMVLLRDASFSNLIVFQIGYMIQGSIRGIGPATTILVLKQLFLQLYGETYNEFVLLKSSTVSMITFGAGRFIGLLLLGGILTEYWGFYCVCCIVPCYSLIIFILLLKNYPFKTQ